MDQLLESAQPQIAVPKSQADSLWYKDALIYEVHVRAFYDSNNDGVGDFPGLTEKLPYLADLGVTPGQASKRTRDGAGESYIDTIAYKVRQIVDWINDPETKRGRNALRIAARAHYDLVRVFPFTADSGKVARLLMNMLLMKKRASDRRDWLEEKGNEVEADI